MSLLCLTTIDKIAGAWGEHYSECDGYLDLLDDFLYNQLLEDCAFSDKTDYNAKIEAIGLFFDIIQNKNLYYNSAKDYLEKCINVLENILKTENFSSWRDPILKRKSTEQFLQDMKDFLKTHKTRSTNLFDKFDEAKEPGCINVHASSEDLEISRGEIGVSIEDYDPSKDKEKSTKNRWSEKPNQNTAVIPAAYQESDNYKKDKLDKAKYTNFLGRTDQDKPVELADFALPNQPARKDETFEKYTDTIQDDQQQYDTRNFGKGKMKPKQYSNFLYKSELLHIEQGIIKEADLNSKKPYLLKDLENSNVDKKEYENIIQLCNKADPTDNKAVYTQWILKQYLNNNFKGEEDVEKFRDTLNKFTKLKNSKKIDQADLNQYKSYGELAEKVNGILEESGGYTSKREEETTKAEEGIKKIDQDGDIELFVVNTPEAAAKEFRNTEWCVKDPKWFNDDRYGGTDRNFYYFKKDGNPYLLLHKNDFRKTNDDEPDNQDLKEVSKLMVKHYLPHQYDLLNDKIITREDGDLFTSVYNKAIEEDFYGMFCYDLLTYTNIANDDPELYDKAMEHVFVNPAFLLMNHRTIKKDNDLYNNLVEAVIEEGDKDTIERLHTYNKISDDVYFRFLKNQEDQQSEEQDQFNNQKQQTQEQPEVEEQQDNINKTQLLHITTIDKIARGYAFDHSKSNNALNAEYQGKFPLTHATKIVAENFGITQQQAKWLLKQIGPTEWHHTSSHYNQTDYYDTNTDSIIEELQEIDNESPISTVEDVREYINSKFVKPEASQEKGYYADFDYIIWGGTRKYPTADEQSLKNVYVVEKGSFYYVYDSEDGDLIVKKKIGSNGTRVHKLPTQEELDERRRIENERISLYNFNTSQETRDFIAQGGSYSSSGNFYPEGKKPSSSEYEAGLDKFFQVGDRIAHLTEFPQGYILQEWNGTEFVDLEDTSKMVSSYEELPEEAKIFKNEPLTISAAEAKDSAGETSITPTVTDNVVDQITQKPTDNVTQGKGGGKPVKGTKRGGTGTRPVKALYSTNLKSIDIIADQFGDWTTRTELPESALKRFRGQDANEKNEKENKDLKKKMKGKPNKPLYNVPKKDVYAWGNDDLMGGAVFYSDMSLPQMGDLSEMN